MANVTRYLTDGISLGEVTSNSRWYSGLSDAIVLGDTFSEIHTEHYTKNISDAMAIGEVTSNAVRHTFERSLSDNMPFSDTLVGTVLFPFLDEVVLGETFSTLVREALIVSINDNIPIEEVFSESHTLRITKNLIEDIILDEIFAGSYKIIVIGGTGTGIYSVNELVQLGATVPDGRLFFYWDFNKSAIDNIYDPDAILTMPAGGGIITAIYVDKPVDADNITIVYDIFDYVYDQKSGNDEILTQKTAIPLGDTMGVAQQNLSIPQGSRFHNVIVFKDSDGDPFDLTNYTAGMQIRKYKEDTGDPELTMNTSNGYLTLGGILGTITMNVPGAITANLDFKWGYYDLEFYHSDGVTLLRILQGRIELSKEVTRV